MPSCRSNTTDTKWSTSVHHGRSSSCLTTFGVQRASLCPPCSTKTHLACLKPRWSPSPLHCQGAYMTLEDSHSVMSCSDCHLLVWRSLLSSRIPENHENIIHLNTHSTQRRSEHIVHPQKSINTELIHHTQGLLQTTEADLGVAGQGIWYTETQHKNILITVNSSNSDIRWVRKYKARPQDVKTR